MSNNRLPVQGPFKLLQPYNKGDVKVYFGREKEARQLAEALKRNKFLLLYGASGTGKTSLIQCGLQGMISPRDWMPIFVRRGNNFIASLRTALQAQYNERFRQRYPDRSPALSPDSSLRDLIKALFSLSYVPIYLILDQFEEIFTLGDKAEQQTFFDALGELRLSEEDLFCKLLIVSREEYIAHFYEYEQQLPFLFENRFRVEKMRREQLLEVVKGTLGYQYDGYPPFIASEGAPEQILDNLTDAKGETDLTDLQVLLDKLYREAAEKRVEGDNGPLVFDKALAGENKIENVLSEFLERQIEQADQKLVLPGAAPATPVALVVLFKLVTPEGTKQNRTAQGILQELSLGKNAINTPQLSTCLALLSSPEMRILNKLKFTGDAEEHYEIWHDRLAAQVFKKFSADEMRQREALVTLKNKQKRFHSAENTQKRNAEFLSVGEIELIGQSLNIERIPSEQQQFYRDSVAYRQKQRRRERLLLAGALVAAVVFAALAGIAWYAWQRSEIARLYNEGLVESARNPTTGLQKILTACQRDPNDAAKRKGAYQVYASHLLYDSIFCEKKGRLNTMAVSPDGAWFATGVKSVVYLYKTGTSVAVDSFSALNAINYLLFNHDTLWAGSEDRKIYAFSGISNDKLIKVREMNIGKNVQQFALDEQGKWLLVAHNSSAAQLFNRAAGVVRSSISSESNIAVTAIAPDGQFWAVGTDAGEILLQNNVVEEQEIAVLLQSPANISVHDLTFSPDGQQLAAALSNGYICLFSGVMGNTGVQFRLSDSIWIDRTALKSVRFSMDGTLLLIAADNGTGYVLDIASKKLIYSLLSSNFALLTAQFAEQEGAIFTAATDGTIRRWTFPHPYPQTSISLGSFVVGEHLAFTQDGRYVVTQSADSLLQVFDGVHFKKAAQYSGHSGAATALATGNTQVVSADEKGEAHLWEVSSGTLRGTTQFGDAPVNMLATDPNCSAVLMASSADSSKVLLWLTADNSTKTLGHSKQMIAALAVSPDGKYCFVANYDSTLTRYDLNGTATGVMRLPDVATALQINQNGLITAVLPQNIAYTFVFGANSGHSLPALDKFHWSKDGSVYASFDPQSGNDQRCTVQLFTGEGFPLQTFRYNNCDITDFALRPDGRVLTAISSNGKVLVWPVRKNILSFSGSIPTAH
jgi:WD40 repeat protein